MFFENGLMFQNLIENKLILRTCSWNEPEVCVGEKLEKPVNSMVMALLVSVVKAIFVAYNPR